MGAFGNVYKLPLDKYDICGIICRLMQKNNKNTVNNDQQTQQPEKFFTRILRKFSFVIFLIGLAAFFALIGLANYLRESKEPEPEEPVQATFVELYQPGQAYLTTQAKVTDKGVVTVVAQTAGVVQRVNVTEGKTVRRGQQLASLSSNYQGANSSALQLELAKKNWLMTHANFWDQEKLDSINYELNQNVAWTTRWETNGGSGTHGNGDAYTEYKGLQNAEVLQIGEQMTQRGQQLALDKAESDYFAAQIAASLMYPATPVAGSVEKVNVKVGDIVQAGSVIAIIKSNNGAVKLELSVPENVIRNLSLTAPAWFEYDGRRYEVTLDFFPTTPTTGNSYYLTMTLDPEAAALLPNGTYVDINLPLDTKQDGRLLLPLNAVYQTQMAAYTYVVALDDQRQPIAKQKRVTLGPVIGTLVSVESGLEANDQVILDNTLMDGERISYTLQQHSATTTYPILTIPTASMSAVLFLE